jgi:type IV secretory pathway VirB10-like protein
MFSNRLAFAALAVACVGAAAGGGYVASRQNRMPSAQRAVGASAPASMPPSSGSPVQETEAVVNETSPTPAPPAVAAPAAKASGSSPKRVEPASPGVDRARPPAAAHPSRSAAVGAKASEPLPTLDRTWPSGASVNTAQVPSSGGAALPAPLPSVETPPPAPRPEEHTAQETPRAPDPPQKTFDELVVPADSVIGLQSETSLTSDRARVEDRVEARVTRDVRVHDAIAIPAGSRALGSVISVERGGKFKERARLGIRFNMLVLADGSRIPISTETIFRDGDPPGNQSAAKIGGATVGGAILGAIFGGGKGAAIGATAGAGAGSASVMASDRNTATLRSGEPITVRILSSVSVTIEQK